MERDNSPQPEDIAHRWAGLFATRLDESGTALLASLRTSQTLNAICVLPTGCHLRQNELQRLPLVQIGCVLSFL